MTDYENKEISCRGMSVIQPVLDIFAKLKDVSDEDLYSRFPEFLSELSKQVPQYKYCEFVNNVYGYSNLSYTLCQDFIKDFAAISFSNSDKNFAKYVEHLDSIEFTVSNFVYEFIRFFCDTPTPTYSDFEICLSSHLNNLTSE